MKSLIFFQNKFKRLRRLEDDDSDNEGNDDPDLEREVIAEKLFVAGSDEVWYFLIYAIKSTQNRHISVCVCFCLLYNCYVGYVVDNLEYTGLK